MKEGLFDFIKNTPTPYHTVAEIKKRLTEFGFTEISEKDSSAFAGDCSFVVRDSSLIAFKGSASDSGFMICASHSDTPALKVKNVNNGGKYSRLAVETYGGLIYNTWFDRPLSLAGRVAVETSDGVEIRLLNFDRDMAVIPNVAPHLNRSVNDGVKLNPAVDLLPLLSLDKNTDLDELISDVLDIDPEEILAKDIFLYNRDCPMSFGGADEFILSPRLDDAACVYASLEAFLDAEPQGINVFAVFDNEEVGSSTKQGAASTFLRDTLLRIAGSEEKYLEMLPDSFMLSADNAHASHPNHPELSDPENAPVLGGGVVIKYNANQRYTTDARSDAVFRTICKRAGVKAQSYTNRADIPGGSTLGSISNTRVSISTVDIGLPQLAMHSANETMAVSDLESMKSAILEFYSSKILTDENNIKII